MTSEVQAFEAPKPALRQEHAFYGSNVYECVHIFNLLFLNHLWTWRSINQPACLMCMGYMMNCCSCCLSSQNLPQKVNLTLWSEVNVVRTWSTSKRCTRQNVKWTCKLVVCVLFLLNVYGCMIFFSLLFQTCSLTKRWMNQWACLMCSMIRCWDFGGLHVGSSAALCYRSPFNVLSCRVYVYLCRTYHIRVNLSFDQKYMLSRPDAHPSEHIY